MADGRKIPYLIELGVTDEKLRQQMSKWDWESIMGGRGKGFGDALINDAKEAKNQMEKTFGGLNIDWAKILGTREVGQLEQAATRALSKSRKEIELLANSGDTTGIENIIKYVSALGNELKGLGSSFDADSLARGMNAFMKVITPLAAKFEALADEPKKVEAAFDRLFSGISDSAKSMDLGKPFEISGKIKLAMNGLKATNDELREAAENIAKYRNVVAKLSGDNPATIKLAQDLDGLNQQLDEQMRKEEQLAAQNKTNSAQYAATLKNIMAIENARLKMKAKPTTDYTGVAISQDFDYYEEKINKVIERTSKKISELEGKLAETVDKSFAEVISKQISDIKLSVSLSDQAQTKFINEINNFVKRVNQEPLDKVKIQIDDAPNIIEDKQKRVYSNNPMDDDAKTTELVNKTANRFDRIAQVIDDKQQSILSKTTDWRNSMINAMQIKAKDLEFQFGLESNMANTADALFNKLQEYFERPEYALDIKFNTEKIVRDLKASLEAEGVELGIGGTTNLDAKSLLSMLYPLISGEKSVNTAAQTGTSSSSTQKEVADETDEAVDSSKEYIKVLDETTIHIDKVIESLRVFAKEVNKANASKGSKEVANRLTNMGIDISAIKNGANDTDIIKMLQDALMSKDEMGKAQGGSLVGQLKGMMKTYGMDSKKGSGRIVDILARDIMELFNINELETELEEQLVRRFEQLEIWKGIEKPGRALAALGNVRSTKRKIKTPAMEQIDEAIKYFEIAEEDTAALKKLKEARQKFEDNGETDEAKKEFENAALVFYEETKAVFNRLKDRWGDFKGVVQAEGRRPVTIDPKGAYPSRILEIPDGAVISKIDIFEVFKTIRDVGFVGSSNRRESSERKAAFEQNRLSYNPNTPNYIVPKPKPKRDIRYEDIAYDIFKTQESKRLPPEVSLNKELASLKTLVGEIPEITKRIESGKQEIGQLEEIKQQIITEISNMSVQDLPEIQMGAFKRAATSDNTILEILNSANSAIQSGGLFNPKNASHLNKEQQLLVNRLDILVQNIHEDSEISQELANKIAEITEAKKLNKQELDVARANATKQGNNTRANLYRDLLFDPSSVDHNLASYESRKNTIDEKLTKDKSYAKGIMGELRSLNALNEEKAIKEAESLATQLDAIKNRLYAEAKTYVEILNNPDTDENTRQVTLGKLQQTLANLNQASGKFANIQAYVPQTHLYTDTQKNNVDKWNKKYTRSELTKNEKKLRELEAQLKEEQKKEEEARNNVQIAELKKQITNTKRNITNLKKKVPKDVVGEKRVELNNIERQLEQEQSQLGANENRLKFLEGAEHTLQQNQADADFLIKYNELLEKEKSLLEEVNKLKREGADKSVVADKTNELKQATKVLDDFITKEQSAERTAYAREAAVEYQAQLQTAYRKRGVFDRQLAELEEDEENLNKYGLSGRVGSRALRKAKRKATDEYMASDDVKAQERAILQNEKLSWQQRDEQLKELRQQLRKDFEDSFDDSNVKSDEEKRLAKLKKDIEAERAPLDDIIKDLQTQKKAAMRYGVVSDEDLDNDKYLKQNDIYNKNISNWTKKLAQKQKELDDIKSDNTLDEKSQEKKIRAAQKEIDIINQEIQRNQILIDNRIKLMELHKQEKEESKQTPEEKALLATEKLVGMKKSLVEMEEKIANKRAEYESSKGTENEVKTLEALDDQIKKRDELQSKIENTEKNIERWRTAASSGAKPKSQTTSTAEEAKIKDDIVDAIDSEIKETIGSVDVNLTPITEILQQILQVLTSGGVKIGANSKTPARSSTKNTSVEGKLARIAELEAKKASVTVASEASANIDAEVVKSKAYKNVSQSQIYKNIQASVDKFRTSDIKEYETSLDAIKSCLDELSKINNTNSQEYIEWQRKLGVALSAYGKKTGVANGRGFYDTIYADLENKGVSVDSNLAMTNRYDVSKALVDKGLVSVKDKKSKANTFTSAEEEELARLKKEIKEVNAAAKDNSGLKDAIPEETVTETDALTTKVEKLKQKFEEAKKVGYLDKNDADLKAFENAANNNEAIRYGNKVSTKISQNRRAYSGITEIRSATRQHDNMEAHGILDYGDLEAVQKYTQAYDALIAKHKEFSTAGTLYDPANQKTLQNMAIKTRDLGKALDKSVAEAEQLQLLVDNSGTYNGKKMGGTTYLSPEETQKLEASMRSYLQTLNLGNVEHIKFDHTHQKLTGTLRTSNKTVADLEIKYNKATGALYAYQKAERESLTGVPAFLNGFKKKFNSIMQYLTMTMSIHRIISEVRRGIQYIREIDKALTELKKVTDESEETYDRFLETAAKTGEKLGSTISAVTEATATFAKLGYTMEQASEMAEAAIVYKNVGDNIASTEDAANSIISTLKGFGMEASESMAIVDKFNEVGNRFAITSQGIGEALRLSASALNEGGNSLDESIAIITAANEVVNDPSSVGTALKTLTLRLRGAKTELEEMGEDVSDMAITTSQLQAKLLALTGGKVDIMLDENTFKNSTQILREMAAAWEDMNDIQRASALELMGGKRQANVLSALIQNFDTVEKVIEASANSSGSALKENERYLDSIQGKIDQFNNSVQAMWSNTLDSDAVKWFVDLGTTLVKVVDTLGLIPSLLITIATYSMIKNKMGPLEFFTSIFESLKQAPAKIKDFAKSFVTIPSEATRAMQGLTVASFQQSLATAGVTEANQAALLSQMGLTEANAAHVIGQQTLNAQTLAQAVNAGTLTAAQAAQLASIYGLTGATAGLTAAQMSQALITAGVSREQRIAIIQSLGLSAATKQLTATEVINTLTAQGMAAGDAQAIAAKLGLTVANYGLAASFVKLWVAMWPVLIVMAAIAAIYGIVELFDYFTVSVEEASEALKDAKEKLSDLKTEFEELETELEKTEDRMAELLAMPSLSFVEQEELEKLKQVSAELKNQMALQEGLIKSQEQSVIVKSEAYLDSVFDEGWLGDNKYTWDGFAGVINEDEWYTAGVDTTQVLSNAFGVYESYKEEYDAIADKTSEEAEELKADMTATMDSIYMVLNDENFQDLSYGQSDKIDAYLDYINVLKFKALELQGIASKSLAIEWAFDDTTSESIKELKEDLLEIVNDETLDDSEKQAKAIETVTNAIKSGNEEYERLAKTMVALELEVADVAAYFVRLGGTIDSSSVEGITAQYQKGIDALGKYQKDATGVIAEYLDLVTGEIEEITWGDLFDDKGEVIDTQISKVMQGADKTAREEFARVVQAVQDGEMELEDAITSFSISGVQAGYKLLEESIVELNSKIFKDLGDDVSGLIDTFEEFGSALESVAKSIDLVSQAEAEMAYSGHLSVETALQLINSTEDWNKVLKIENGNITLVDGAMDILAQSKLDQIKANLQLALSEAKAGLEQARLAENSGEVAKTLEESTTESVRQLSANMGYLSTLIAEFLDGNFWGAHNAAKAAKNQILTDTAYQKTTTSSSMSVADYEKQVADIEAQIGLFEGVDTVGEFPNNYSSDKVSGGNDNKEDVANDAFQGLMDYYENRIAANQAKYEQIQNEIDLMEKKGQKADASFYEKQIELEGQRQALLEDQRDAALTHLATLEKGSEEWWEVANTLNDIEGELDDVTASIVDLQDAIGEIDAYKFEEFNTRLDNLTSKLETIRNLIAPDGEEDWFDDEGNWTEAGVAVAGTYLQELETYKQGYQETMDELAKYESPYAGNEDYYASLGIHSEQEHYDKTEELISQQYDFAESISDTEQSIVDMYESSIDATEEYIETLIDGYNDYIDSVKEALDAERKLFDFKKNVQKQAKDISELERRIASLSGSTNASDIAERRKLEAQLYESRESLNDTYYDHAKDAQSEALDAEATAYEETMTKMVETMHTSLQEATTDMESFLYSVTVAVSMNADTVLAKYQDTELDLDPALTNPWIHAAERAKEYAGDVAALMDVWKNDGYFAEFSSEAGVNLSSPWSIGTDAVAGFRQSVVSEMQSVVSNVESNVKTASSHLANLYRQIQDTATQAANTNITVGGSGSSSSGGSGGSSGYVDGPPSPSKQNVSNIYGLTNDQIMALGYGPLTLDEFDNLLKSYQIKYSAKYLQVANMRAEERAIKKVLYGEYVSGPLAVRKHAKGTLGTKRNEWAITDEPWLGDELTMYATPEGTLSYMRTGSTVVPADLTKEIIDMAELGVDGLVNMPKFNSGINIISNAINKPEINLSFDALVKAERIDENTLPEVKRYVQQEINTLVKQMNYAIKGKGGR